MSNATSMPDAYARACADRSAPTKAERYARTDVRTYEELSYGRSNLPGPYQARAYADSTRFPAASPRNLATEERP